MSKLETDWTPRDHSAGSKFDANVANDFCPFEILFSSSPPESITMCLEAGGETGINKSILGSAYITMCWAVRKWRTSKLEIDRQIYTHRMCSQTDSLCQNQPLKQENLQWKTSSIFQNSPLLIPVFPPTDLLQLQLFFPVIFHGAFGCWSRRKNTLEAVFWWLQLT